MRLFLSGDVMLGRGVDQVLPHPSDPVLFEDAMRSASQYVELAERAAGPIPRRVPHDYVWGDAIQELERRDPDLRLINLETAVTTSRKAAPKGINYRMHPQNVPVLQAARIDGCVLANNHVLDWGREGLLETLHVLRSTSLGVVGAGGNLREARAPMVLEPQGGGRAIVLAWGSGSSGIPASWGAGRETPGVNLMDDPGCILDWVADTLAPIRQDGDRVVLSVHWGGNWEYQIPAAQRDLAHALIDEAGVDVIHGHSSHHPKAIEIYKGRPILYGCGDLLNDYEGIGGHTSYRSELVLAYFLDLAAGDGSLRRLEMAPFEIRAFSLRRAGEEASRWLCARMDSECARFGGHVRIIDGSTLSLSWS